MSNDDIAKQKDLHMNNTKVYIKMNQRLGLFSPKMLAKLQNSNTPIGIKSPGDSFYNPTGQKLGNVGSNINMDNESSIQTISKGKRYGETLQEGASTRYTNFGFRSSGGISSVLEQKNKRYRGAINQYMITSNQ